MSELGEIVEGVDMVELGGVDEAELRKGLTPPFGLRGFEELSPWVTTANFDDFPQALRGELPGVREKLVRYQWRRVAGEALQVYEALAAARSIR